MSKEDKPKDNMGNMSKDKIEGKIKEKLKDRLKNIPDGVWNQIPDECKEKDNVLLGGFRYKIGSYVSVRIRGTKLTYFGVILCVAPTTGHIYIWTAQGILFAHVSQISYMIVHHDEKGEIE